MNERDLVRILQRQSPLIGDDCAVLPNGRTDLLVTTDQFIEDVHFRRDTHSASDIGWAMLARGLSDIASMGGTPDYAFVSLALPEWAGASWVKGFYRGFHSLAKRHSVKLGGGDLSHAASLYCDVLVLGAVPRGKALLRSGATPGDTIYVSGPLGRPKKRPQPRVEIGQSLRGRATACMDLSDGLSLDLARLCEASCVGAEISAVPVGRGASIESALHGGEDYELLFTSRRRLPYFAIGTICTGRGVTFDGTPLEPRGYDHFAQRTTRSR